MARANFTISIDPNVWQSVQLKYPRKVSKYIENYLKALIEIEDLDSNFNYEKELIKIAQEEAEIKRKKQILEQKAKISENEEDKQEQERIDREWKAFKRVNPLRYL